MTTETTTAPVERGYTEETFPDGRRARRWAARTVDAHPTDGEVVGRVMGLAWTGPYREVADADSTVLVEVAVPIVLNDDPAFGFGGGVRLVPILDAPAVTTWRVPDDDDDDDGFREVPLREVTLTCHVDHTRTRDVTDLTDTIRRWHDDTHPDPYTVCQHPVCRALRETLRG